MKKKILSFILVCAMLMSLCVPLCPAASAAEADPNSETLAGDVNGDGVVNLKDVVALYRYVAGWDVDVNLNAVDANNDQDVDLNDALDLFKNQAGDEAVEIPGHTHVLTHVPAKEAKLDEDGCIEHYYCNGCTQYFTDETATRCYNILYGEGGVLIPATGSAGLVYAPNADDTYSVTGIGTCTDTDIVIPAYYEGKKVTDVAANAFKGNTAITKITLLNGVVTIGASAFSGCTSLASITFPKSLKVIGSYAFSGCTALTSIGLPVNMTTIGDHAFSDCSRLVSIEIPKGVTSLGEFAFLNCTGLAQITVAKGNSTYRASGNCLYNLATKTLIAGCKNSVIPTDGSIVNIAAYAFAGCVGLTAVTIPESVTVIGASAFSGCSTLALITYEGTKAGWETVVKADGWNTGCNYTVKYAKHVLEYYPAVEACHVPGMMEYWYCTDCNTVYADEAATIPTIVENLVIAPDCALAYVPATEACHVPGSREYWYCPECELVYADAAGTVLTNHKDLEIAPDCALVYIPAAAACHVPGTMELWYCPECELVYADAAGTILTNRKNLEIAPDCELVYVPASEACHVAGTKEFWYCPECQLVYADAAGTILTNRKALEVAPDCELIHVEAVPACHKVGNAEYWFCPECNNVYADQAATQLTNFMNLIIPGDLSMLKHFDRVEPTLTANGMKEHWYCDGCKSYYSDAEGNNLVALADLIISTVAASEGLAFTLNEDGESYSVSGIGTCTDTALVIPSVYEGKPVTGIADDSFLDNQFITSVVIPSSITTIGDHAFASCPALESMTVDAGNTTFYSVNNCVVEIATKTIVSGCKTSIIPSDGSVTGIGRYAFFGCVSFENLVIPEGIVSIDIGAFRSCPNLVSITFPASVTSIGIHSIAGCNKLETIKVASGNTVYHSAGNCLIETATKTLVSGCKNSVIPADGSVEIIGTRAFREIATLANIVIPDTVTTLDSYAFRACTSLESIVIPEGVTSIGDYAFYGCTSLKSITLPESLTTIGKTVFRECTSLESVVVPKNLARIGAQAFYGCTSLKNVTISEGVTTIGTYAFGNCTALESIVIPEGVTTIEREAFKGCTNLESVSIPVSVTSIDSNAFSDCENLNRIDIKDVAAWCAIDFTNIFSNPIYWGHNLYLNGVLVTDLVIPAEVTSIPFVAFFGCTSLKTISIGANVSSIDSWTFSGCDNVESITVDAANKTYHVDGNCLIHTEDKRLIAGFTTSVIPSDGSVVVLDSGAFRHLTNLKSIEIPGTVVELRAFVFMDCTSLESIVMHKGVETIGSRVFSGCTNLTSVTIPNTITSISGAAFIQCTNLKNFTFDGSPSEWAAVEKAANWNAGFTFEVVCTKEDHVHNLVHVEAKAATCTVEGNIEYWYCDSCDWMQIEDGTETNKLAVVIPVIDHTLGEWTVETEATATTNGLRTNTCTVCGTKISEIIPYTGSKGLEFSLSSDGTYYSFMGIGSCTDTEIYIPAVYNGLPVREIPKNASIPSKVVRIHIPASITKIQYTGWNSKLQRVYIYDLEAWCNISFSGTAANPLYRAKKLYLNGELVEELVIPKEITNIRYAVFSGCTSITSVVIPDSVKSISQYAFDGCTGLTTINIPKSVTFISSTAFRNCTALENINVDAENARYCFIDNCLIEKSAKVLVLGNKNSIIPTDGSVTAIGEYAFYGCKELVSLSLPDSITSIGDYAFRNCSALAGITIPAAVTSIGFGAFNNCDALTAITIPAGVTSIGLSAFMNCANIESINVESGNTVYHSAGNCLIETATKTIIAGCKNSVIPTDGSVIVIAEDAFYGCEGLTSIVIPAGVTTIGEFAFYGCTSLTSIDLPESLTSLGGYAFNNCVALKSVVIPAGVTNIGSYTFYDCSALESVTIPASVTNIDRYAFAECTSLTTFIFGGTSAEWEAVTKGSNWNRNSTFTVIFAKADDGHTHNFVTLEAVAPTCTAAGLTEGMKCSVCGMIVVEQTTLAALGHTAGEWVVDKAATKTEEGSKHTNCTVCGVEFKTYIQPIASEGLVYTLNADKKSYTLTGMGTCTDTFVVIAGEYEGLPVTMIAEDVFNEYTTLESLYIPASITSFGWSQFWNCRNLTKVMISDLTAWCNISFNGNPLDYANNLYLNGELVTELVIPEGVTEIKDMAFFGATCIVSVVIPESVEYIGSDAFGYCENLKEITIPKNVSTIRGWAFEYSGIESVIVDPENKTFTVVNNCLINTVEKSLVYGYGNCTIPTDGSVTRIENAAFANNDIITEVVIPDGVTYIGGSAFSSCNNLVSVVIPESVSKISTYVFSGCNSLESVNIPAGITTIGSGTFQNCKKLTSILIPGSVTKIDQRAFSGCTSLTTFIFDGTSAEWEAVTKGTDWNRNCTFTVTFTKGDDGHTHEYVAIEAVAPTCTATGLTEGSKCSVCGLIAVEQTVVDMIDHTMGEWTVVTAATKTENGLKTSTCTVCGNTVSEVIPFTGSEGLEFSLSSDGTYYSLVGMGTCTDTDLYIPSVHNGLPVTDIPGNASLAENLTEVHIPASIQTIVYSGWGNDLQAVHITDLAAWCKISFDFMYANPLCKAEKLYLDGYLVTDLLIPGGVTKILNYTFFNATCIKSITIPDSVTAIYSSAFYGCSDVTEISIPASVTTIAGDAFSNFQNLQKLTVDPQNPEYHSIDNCIIETDRNVLTLACKTSVIPTDGSVTMIGFGAFESRGGISEIIIPAGVTEIHVSAFDGCYDLKNITIPNSMRLISFCAFQGCEDLTITFDGTSSEWEAINKMYEWDNGCTYSLIFNVSDDGHTHEYVAIEAVAPTCTATGLTEGSKCSVCGLIAVEQTVVDMIDHTMGEWTVVTAATKTENGLKTSTCTVCGNTVSEVIPFTGSEGLEFSLSDDGTYYNLIGMGTCEDTDLYIPSYYNNIPVTTIPKNASIPTTVETIHIPASITSIAYTWNRTEIKGVYIYDLAAWCNIKFSAANSNPLHRAKNLYLNGELVTELVIPEGAEVLKHAFRGCTSITSVVLPDSLTTINTWAFLDCSGITSINIPKGVFYIFGNVFEGCTALKTINVDAENEHYYFTDNCLIYKTGKTLIWGNENSIIPTDGSVTNIGASAFVGCTGLSSIIIPESVTSIGGLAFKDCTGITSITIPAGVTSIGSYAFAGCPALESITVESGNTVYHSVGNCLIETATKSLVAGCKNSIIPDDGSVTSIAFAAFNDCSSLTSITIPNGVTTIGEWAFGFCNSLTSVTIPNSVVSIGRYAFNSCYSITSFVFDGTSAEWEAVTKGDYWQGGCSFTVTFAGEVHEHTVVVRKAISPTCVKEGNVKYWYCQGCGTLWADEALTVLTNMKAVTLPATGEHTLVTNSAKEATCGDGNVEYTYCKYCSYVALPDGTVTTLDATVIKGTGEHTVIKVEASDPTCEAKGYKEHWMCEVCSARWLDQELTTTTTASAVTRYACSSTVVKVAQKAATCTEVGYKVHYECKLCGRLFTSSNAQKTTTLSQLTIKKKAHTLVLVPRVEATETTAGNIEYSYCSVCGWMQDANGEAVDKESVVIPPLSEVHTHNLVHVEAKAATCTAEGNIEYWYCDSCDWMQVEGGAATNKLAVITPATDHTGEWVVETEATNTENGLQTLTCTVCGTKVSKIIPYTGSTGLKFSKSSDGTYYSFTGTGSCTDTTIYIPAVYNGLPVTTITSNASISKNVKAIHIPASITKIQLKNWSSSLKGVYIYDLEAWCNISFSSTSANPLVRAGKLYLNGALLTDLVIPKGVTEIKFAAFSGCKTITSVTIPASVTTISSFAFDLCTGLTAISIPKSVGNIATSAFRGCTALENVKVDAENERYSFTDNCLIDKIDKVLIYGNQNSVIPTDGSVATIGAYAFYNCTALAGIALPDSITNIESYAFYGCKALTAIPLPAGLTTIGNDVFRSCSGLTSITVPASVTSIGESVLRDCSSLESITVESGNTAYHSAGNCLIETATKTIIAGCKNSVIPTDGSVTAIGEDAFYGCEGLTSIVIPAGVTTIGAYAFYGCTSLTSIELPAELTSIGNYAFYNCTSLANIELSKSLTSIGNYAFSDCTSLVSVQLPESLTSIGASAFRDCTALENIVIPTGVTSIENYTFYGCTSLASVRLPAGITSIGTSAFNGCKSLASIVLPESLTSIGDSVFSGCSSLATVNIPASVTSIGASAFRYCVALKNITIPAGVTNISKYAFADCTLLTSFIFDGMSAEWEAVTKGANWNLNSPFTVTIAKGDDGHTHVIVTLPAVAATCTTPGLTEGSKCSVCDTVFVAQTEIPASHTESEWITDKVPTATESGSRHKTCTVCGETVKTEEIPVTGSAGLEFTLSDDSTYYSLTGLGTFSDTDLYIPSVYEGLPVTTIAKSLVLPETLTKLYIPASITSIDYTGWRKSNLKGVYITDLAAWCNIDFYTINANPLSQAKNLYVNGVLADEIVIPEGVTTIEFAAFYGCESITSVALPESLLRIDISVFYNCINLASVAIPKGVNSIAGGAFIGCTSLETITVDPANERYCFVDNCLIDKIDKVLVFGNAKAVIPTDGSVTAIDSNAFNGITGLTSISIPETVTIIRNGAFEGCTDLTSITIPSGVTIIDLSAFEGCTALTSVTIPASVKTIGRYAFRNCTAITDFTFTGTSDEWEAVTKNTDWNLDTTFTVTFAPT